MDCENIRHLYPSTPPLILSPGHPSIMHANFIAICELLELRSLLSATLTNGLLRITGTPAADWIILSTATNAYLPIPFPQQIAVSINSQRTLFDVSTITSIQVFGLGGDDLIYVSGLDPNDDLLRGLADFPLPVLINGGAGMDAIGGTDHNDTLIGGSGNDVIFADSGNDRIVGGDGDDLIHGEAGDDTILGGLGDDYLLGEADNDLIKGGWGDDQIEGGRGNDLLFGGEGDDDIRGHGGLDTLLGNRGNDTLFGNAGNDTLAGGFGSDSLLGGRGTDRLSGGPGSNTLQQD
jgi:Ca2+-binding RTX toxin-like protein